MILDSSPSSHILQTSASLFSYTFKIYVKSNHFLPFPLLPVFLEGVGFVRFGVWVCGFVFVIAFGSFKQSQNLWGFWKYLFLAYMRGATQLNSAGFHWNELSSMCLQRTLKAMLFS